MRVDIGGGTKLFFDAVGGSLDPGPVELRDKPTLLLLHGGPGSDHSVFRPWFDRFADTHQVIYLDHRGQGRSDERRDPTGWHLDTWADDVVRFCDALEIERPIVLGQSFGGFVALHYAGRHPEHPGGLVLSSTAARHHVEATLDAFERLGGAAVREVAARFWSGDATPDEMLRYDEVCTPLYNRRAVAEDAPRRVWTNHRVLVHFVAGEHHTFDLRPDLAAIACRTLVLAGVDDPVCPVPVHDEMVAVLTEAGVDVEAHLFEDCGHGSYRDQPEETERVLRAWLR
jgi:pimeloyl-ACP methyl ester carboxylesterase